MPSPELVDAFERANEAHTQAVRELVPLLARMALETIADVLAGAVRLEVRGELNEDWLQILRIERVSDATGRVLFDVASGHVDRAVEDTVDEVNIEYLDRLVELTGDDFMGEHEIDAETVRALTPA